MLHIVVWTHAARSSREEQLAFSSIVFAKKAYGKEHTAESIQWFRLKVFEALLDPIAILLVGRIVI